MYSRLGGPLGVRQEMGLRRNRLIIGSSNPIRRDVRTSYRMQKWGNAPKPPTLVASVALACTTLGRPPTSSAPFIPRTDTSLPAARLARLTEQLSGLERETLITTHGGLMRELIESHRFKFNW
jgi:hypothetical protein